MSDRISGIVRAVRQPSGKLLFLEVDDGKSPLKWQIVCDLQTTFLYPKDKTIFTEAATAASKTPKESITPKESQLIPFSKAFFGEWCYVTIEVRKRIVRKAEKVGSWQHPEECQADKIQAYGSIEHATFPLPPYIYGTKSVKMSTLLKDYPQLRIRHPVTMAILRVRSVADQAIRKFMKKREVLLAHTPILTGADCEGAGETFFIRDSAEFFGREDPVTLTVSGQLDGEVAALGLRSIYTFGPTFRAEHSRTRRHMAEFWMMEPELAFITYEELQTFIIDFLQFCIGYVLEKCALDLRFLDGSGYVKSGLLEKLQICMKEVKKIDYVEALLLLRKLGYSEAETQFGIDLGSEMEMKLTEHFGSMVMVLRYPTSLKSFYMKECIVESEVDKSDVIDTSFGSDFKEVIDTSFESVVECMDVLAPGIGEIVGGSMREEDYGKLKQKMEKLGVKIPWYLDLRKHSTVPHGGFGLGFDRFVQFLTGAKRIQHVAQMPRSYKSLVE